MNPFEFIDSICTKKSHFPEFNRYYDSAYNPFVTNRHLSYFPDTIFLAQDMNLNWQIPRKMQYEYYYTSVRPKRRFKRWPPQRRTPEEVQLVSAFYGVNYRRAREYVNILSDEEISRIRSEMSEGGVSND